jgi:hypothetical protein
MKVEFYRQAGATYGSVNFLGEAEIVIADGGSPQDTWSYAELSGIAPANAVEARLTFVFQQPASNPGGSVFVDSVTLDVLTCPADITGDGLLNFFDVAGFVALYTARDAAADLNMDAQFSFFDIAAYIAMYNQGCP